MADRIEHFDVVADAGLPLPSSLTTAVTFPPGTITAIQVHIPGGHRGRTGLRVFYGSAQVVPRTFDTWLRGNKKDFRFELDDPFPGGEGWFTEVYNGGAYSHTFELTLEITDAILSVVELPPVLLLRSAGSLATEGGGVPVAPGSGGGGSIGGPVQE